MTPKVSTRVITHGSDAEAAQAARKGAEAILAGKLVGFGTETVYGIAALATDAGAMDRLRQLKSRPKRPFSVHLGVAADVHRYVADPPPPARRLISRAWPGPVTVILPTGGTLADSALEKAGLHRVLCADDMIGLRCPDSRVAQAMLAGVGEPVVATSANMAGGRPPRTADQVVAEMDGRIDLLIDSGPMRYGKDSTIVRFGPKGWQIVREGVCDAQMIGELLRERWLFVCTGNTCRSPMAQGLARKMLAERLGCKVNELICRGFEVVSAGAFAADGARASPEAVQIAAELGVDIDAHRSQRVTRELIKSADMVFCMSDTHVSEVLRLVPSASPRVRRLDKAVQVLDPIGGGLDACRRSARQIERALRTYLKEEAIS